MSSSNSASFLQLHPCDATQTKESTSFNKHVKLSQINFSSNVSSVHPKKAAEFNQTLANKLRSKSKSYIRKRENNKSLCEFAKGLRPSNSTVSFDYMNLSNTQKHESLESVYLSALNVHKYRDDNRKPKLKLGPTPTSIKIIKRRNDRNMLCQANTTVNGSQGPGAYSEVAPLSTHYYLGKPQFSKNGSMKSLNLSICEDSNTDNRKQTISNRGREMQEILSKLEKNISNMPKEKLAKHMKETLKGFIAEIIKLQPHFGYVLKKVHEELEGKNDSTEKLKVKNTELVKIVEEVNKKYAASEASNKTLKAENEKLEKEVADLRLKLFDARSKLAEAVENGITGKIAEEIEELYKENRRLRQLTNAFKADLKKAQIRENALISLMQSNEAYNTPSKEMVEPPSTAEKKINDPIEVGKNKVKIPRLDFSMVQRSISSDEGEEELEEGEFIYLPDDGKGGRRLCFSAQQNKL